MFFADKAKARQYLKASETEESVYQKKQLWSGMLSGTIYEDSYFNKNLFWGYSDGGGYNDDAEFSFRNSRIFLGRGIGLKCETEKLRVEQEEVVNIYRENIHEYDDAGDGDCCCQGPCGPEYCDDDIMKLYDSEEELQELEKEDPIYRVEPDNRANARKRLERAIEEYDQNRTVDRTKSDYSDYGSIPMMLMRLYGTDVLSKGSLDTTIQSDPDMAKVVHCLKLAIKYYNSELDTDRVMGGFTIRNILDVILSWDIQQGNETQSSYYRSYYNICDHGFGLFDAFVRIDGETPEANKIVNENKLNCYKQLYSHCERAPNAPSSVCDNTRNYIQSATASSFP